MKKWSYFLRSAQLEDLGEITGLCLRSKAVWLYGDAFLRACEAELAVTPNSLKTSQIQVAADEDSIVGVVQLLLTEDQATLEKLFVEPSRFGCGIGRALFYWAVATARSGGANLLTIDSDPGAVGFYVKMGAVQRESVESGSIPGRRLPRLIYKC